MTYSVQTFPRHRGFNFGRFITVVLTTALLTAGATGAVMFTPLSDRARALTLRSSIVDRGSPLTLLPGGTANVTLRFRNAGLTTWQRGVAGSQVDLGVRNDSHEFAGAGMAVDWLSADRIATTNESLVPPGQIGTFTFTVRAPTTLGVYRVPVQLVVDGVTWLDDQQVFVVVASDFGFHSELIEQSPHPTVRAGEMSAPLTLKIRNIGTRPWVRGKQSEQVNLGAAGDAAVLGAAAGWPTADRVAIQTEPRVDPGGVGSFVFRVRAPATAGIYSLRLRPVVDGVTWLEDLGVMSLVTVTSASGQPQPFSAPAPATLFATSAAVAPASVTAGDAASISASFTSNTATTALVGVEVYAPQGGTLAFQKWYDDPQTFAAGQPRSYPLTWQIPATAGVGLYTVRLRAFTPGWKTLLHSNDAATFTVAAAPVSVAPQSSAGPVRTTSGAPTSAPAPTGTSYPADPTTVPAIVPATNPPTLAPTATAAATPAPSFTASAAVAPAAVNPNGSMNVTASYTSATAVTVNLVASIFAPGASIATYQQSYPGQSFGAGQQRSYSFAWTIPSGAAIGMYRVALGVYSTDGLNEYKWMDTAATFAVNALATPTPTTATATPAPTAAPTATPAPTVPAPLAFPDDPTGFFDLPTPSASVSGNVLIWGWSIDRNATGATTGVDRVVLYRDGPPGTGTLLGTATYGISRPDVGSYFGNARWNGSGWSFNWVVGVLSAGTHTLYAEMRSTVTGATKLMSQSVVVPGAATPPPAPPPTGRVPAPVIAPSAYAVPAGALSVSNTASLLSALAGGTARDIVLAPGVYDNGGPFMNGSGHHLYSATLGGAVLRAGLVIGGTGGVGGGSVQGVTFDVNDSSKTFQDSIVNIWGTAGRGARILDTTFEGNNVVGEAVLARQPEGFVMQRVRARDFRVNGFAIDANVQNLVLATPILMEDVDVANVSAAVPRSFDGRAEACIWMGNTGTLRRALIRNCAWMGLWTGTSDHWSVHEDLDIDGTPTGVYIEHFGSNSTFQRMRIGSGVRTGVNCEWADPAWGSLPACVDEVIQDSTFYSWNVGVYMDEGTTRTTVRRSTFIGQQWAAIVDYRGISNSYSGNDYSQIAAGAVPVR